MKTLAPTILKILSNNKRPWVRQSLVRTAIGKIMDSSGTDVSDTQYSLTIIKRSIKMHPWEFTLVNKDRETLEIPRHLKNLHFSSKDRYNYAVFLIKV